MVPVLLSVESVLLILIGLLVLGLLRSHAEILRWQTAFDERAEGHAGKTGGDESQLDPMIPEYAPAIVGVDLFGLEPRRVEFSNRQESILLAFLSSGCRACEDFWHVLRSQGGTLDVPGGGEVLVVGKDPTDDSLSRLRKRASRHVNVVLSSAAWEEFGAARSPYFVHVGADGKVIGAGVSDAWHRLRETLESGIEDSKLAAPLRPNVAGNVASDSQQNGSDGAKAVVQR